MTDKETMLLIKSKNKDCVFSQAELIDWIVEEEGVARNTASKRVPRVIKRLPVELLGGKYYRLLYSPEISVEKEKVAEKKGKTAKKESGLGFTPMEVVDYLNLKTGKSFKGKPADLLRIKARINESHTLEDFKTVIDKKVAEWTGTSFEKFLRPETLFSTKFESYLNQTGSSNQQSKVDQMAEYDFEKYIRGD